MREFYKLLSLIGDIQALIKGGLAGWGKRQVNKQAHKTTAKLMRGFWSKFK